MVDPETAGRSRAAKGSVARDRSWGRDRGLDELGPLCVDRVVQDRETDSEVAGAEWVPGYAAGGTARVGAIAFPTASLSIRLGWIGQFGRRGTDTIGFLEWESCNLLDMGCEFAGSPEELGTSAPAISPPITVSTCRFASTGTSRSAHATQIEAYLAATNVLGSSNVLRLPGRSRYGDGRASRDATAGSPDARVGLEILAPAALRVSRNGSFEGSCIECRSRRRGCDPGPDDPDVHRPPARRCTMPTTHLCSATSIVCRATPIWPPTSCRRPSCGCIAGARCPTDRIVGS